MGLRIHRSSSLPLPLTCLDPEAPATGATLTRTILISIQPLIILAPLAFLLDKLIYLGIGLCIIETYKAIHQPDPSHDRIGRRVGTAY